MVTRLPAWSPEADRSRCCYRSTPAQAPAPALNLTQDLYVSGPLKTGRIMVKDEDVCLHCSLCAERCPTGAWDMQKSTVSIPYAAGEARAEEAEWQDSRKAG